MSGLCHTLEEQVYLRPEYLHAADAMPVDHQGNEKLLV